jgi:hypothetical protein
MDLRPKPFHDDYNGRSFRREIDGGDAERINEKQVTPATTFRRIECTDSNHP